MYLIGNKYQEFVYQIRKIEIYVMKSVLQFIYKRNSISIITRSLIIDFIAENPNLIVKGNKVVNRPTGDASGIC